MKGEFEAIWFAIHALMHYPGDDVLWSHWVRTAAKKVLILLDELFLDQKALALLHEAFVARLPLSSTVCNEEHSTRYVPAILLICTICNTL
jgi:hypothetical protein